MTKKEAVETIKRKLNVSLENPKVWIKKRRGSRGYLVIDDKKREIYFVYDKTGAIFKAY